MEQTEKNSQLIFRCECPYCQSFLSDYEKVSSQQDERSDQVKTTNEQNVLKNVSTNEPILVSGEKVVLSQFLYEPKKELRGVWVTTVRNTDFPTKKVFESGSVDVELFKKEYLNILQTCQRLNLNAVLVQVRPEGDSLYPSKLNPYSEYLSGKQGNEAGLNGFDPLAWMIEQTHKVGIEFHAWFNPYRLTPSTKRHLSKDELFDTLAATNYGKKYPEDTYFYNGQLFLNPGVPRVNKYVIDSIMEVVQNYNIDAVHLDDYFYGYPYETTENGVSKFYSFAESGLDQSAFDKYNKKDQSIEKWREENINNLIRGISNAVHQFNKQYSKSIAFGISPFGVWDSAEKTNGVGSNTSSSQLASLDEYVNSKLWIDEGLLDYIVPQNYWSFEDELSPFGEVAYWWNKIVAGKDIQLYMGLGIYLYDEDQDNPAWKTPDTMLNQILYGRLLSENDGFVFFTYNNLVTNTEKLTESEKVLDLTVNKLKQTVLAHKALIPPRTWLQTGETKPIKNLRILSTSNEVMLSFQDDLDNNSQYYAIYRIEGENKPIILRDDKYLIDVVGKNQNQAIQQYHDMTADKNKTYTYGVTAVSQAQVESKLTKLVSRRVY
ncbi:MAG TPA: hypothetical protein DCY20_06050 [Firmicutes bacterium]|nr:hypothetical protein [Bacillota bacterium]